MTDVVLVIAAHPDDEVLGCGGTIARHAVAGDQVHVSILGQGLSSRGQPTAEEVSALRGAARRANELLGAASLHHGDFPDNRMDTVPRLDVTQAIESLISQHKPRIVYTHWAGDVNIDHRRIHEGTIVACRPQPGHPVEALLFFEVPSSTEWQIPGAGPAFTPNWFVNVAATLQRKLDALNIYASEMRSFPHPRSPEAVQALARWRGATVGVAAAEAFVLGRGLVR